MYAGEVEGGAVLEDARQATGAHLGTWRGGGEGKNTRWALKMAREQWEIQNKKIFHFGKKKRLEPLKTAQWAILSMSWISGSVPAQFRLSSSAHCVRGPTFGHL